MAQENKRILHEVPAAPVSRYTLTAKVSDKGCVSIYGMRQFPFSFYREEIEAILASGDKIRAFITANADRLPTKAASPKSTNGRTAL